MDQQKVHHITSVDEFERLLGDRATPPSAVDRLAATIDPAAAARVAAMEEACAAEQDAAKARTQALMDAALQGHQLSFRRVVEEPLQEVEVFLNGQPLKPGKPQIAFRAHGDPTYPNTGPIFLTAPPPEPSAVDRLAALSCSHAAEHVRKGDQRREDYFKSRESRGPLALYSSITSEDLK